jgi:hypothetical protein
MNNEGNDMQELGEKFLEYAETRYEHARLSFIYTSIGVGSQALSWILILLSFFIFYLCLVIGASLWIGNLLGATYLGFFVLMGIHLVFFLLVLLFRRALVERPFKERLTKAIFNSRT